MALASCGGASHSSTASSVQAGTTTAATTGSLTAASSTSTTSPTQQTTATPVGSSSTTSPTPTTTSASGGAAISAPGLCRAADLAVSYLGGQGATGHGELGFALRNTSSHSCQTHGFPGVLFLGHSGQALPTRSTRSTQDFFGPTPIAAIRLGPGANASFRLGVTHGAGSTAGCTTAKGLQVIPPNDTSALRVTIGNGGAYECGTTTVSPLRPGNSAFP